MKAILMSIRSTHGCNVLNGIKKREIRKKFPKDYVGWIYLYITKGKPYLSSNSFKYYVAEHYEKYMGNWNGKVVARFWCDKVDEFYDFDDDLCKQACLNRGEMLDYLGNKNGYAIHITKLKIFDKPKDISEFMKVSCKGCPFENTQTCHNDTDGRYCKLTRAPQSWCYVEV